MTSKKTLTRAVAASTSAVLGVVGSVAGAVPAHATTTGPVGIDACTNLASLLTGVDDLTTVMDFSQEFVMPCVPQYGLGKIEFTISSATDLPEGFALEDAVATAVTEDFDIHDVVAYSGVDVGDDLSVQSPSAFQSMYRVDDGSDPASATYQALLILPLESVDVVDLASLPAECTGTYTHAYRVEAQSRTTTFTGQSGLTAWSVPITVTPTPIQFAINMSADGTTTNGDSCISILDETQPISGVTDPFIYKAGTMLLLGLGVFAAAGLTGDLDLPFDFAVRTTPVETDVTVTETPALPSTGVDMSDIAAGAAGAVSLLVLGGYLVTRRRARSSTRDA
jgi:LPXTG-motif cell wall-anchored protein